MTQTHNTKPLGLLQVYEVNNLTNPHTNAVIMTKPTFGINFEYVKWIFRFISKEYN